MYQLLYIINYDIQLSTNIETGIECFNHKSIIELFVLEDKYLYIIQHSPCTNFPTIMSLVSMC